MQALEYWKAVTSDRAGFAVAAEDLEETERLLRSRYKVVRFPHSLNVSMAGSDLRAQIQTDPRYASFVAHAEPREVLGLILPVASVEDVLQGKKLRNRVPPDVLARLI